MNIYCCIFVLAISLTSNCAQYSLDDWQCDLMTNSTNLYSLVNQQTQNVFHVIGYSSWMVDNKPFISCFQKGLTKVPTKLDTNVTILDLSQNSITKIGKNDFTAYKSLMAIMIRQNCELNAHIFHTIVPPCKSSYLEISSNAFNSLSSLKYLDLSGNRLKNIPINLPKNLLVLNIFFSRLGHLNSSHVKDLTSLQVARLSANCFGKSSTSFCEQNFSIEHFSLPSSNLSYLDLSFNNLSKVPSKLFNNALLGLNLRGNPIHSISRDDFKNCSRLTHLYFSWTAKYDFVPLNIHPHSLMDLNNLKHLDLSGNMLKNWSQYILPNNSQLQAWNLAFNCFKERVQDPSFLPSLQNLTILDLSSNTLCSSEFYPYRPIVSVMKLGKSFLKFPNLEALLLGTTIQPTEPNLFFEYFIANGVKFDTVDSESLNVLRNLTKLHTLAMTLMGIRNLSMETFQGLKNLRNLDLKYNHIGEPQMQNDYKQKSLIRHVSKDKNPFYHSFPMISFFHNHLQLSSESLLSFNAYQSYLKLSRNAISDLNKHPLKYFPMTTELDLSDNRINYISADTFQNLTKLIEINLKFNPIRFIHPNALNGLSHLSLFTLNFTVYQEEFTLTFLQNCTSNLTLHYGDISNNFFRLMEDYWEDNFTINTVTNLQLSNIQIRIFDIATNRNIFKPFPYLTHLSIEGGRVTYPLKNKFFNGVSGLKTLAMINCWLQKFPYNALNGLPHLTLLDLSYNEIDKLEPFYFSNISTNLQTFNMSHNFINHITPYTFQSFMQHCPNLTTIDLSFNNIAYIGPNVLGRSVLERLAYFDLRGNVLECNCTLSENFGYLIQKGMRNLVLPGFLPVCDRAVQDYYGGCLTCRGQSFTPSISLFHYSTTNYCDEMVLTLLSLSCAMLIFLFVTLTLLANSSFMKNFLIKTLSINVIGVKQSKPHGDSTKYAFDGFVYYDKENETVADWVDLVFVPNLEQGDPKFKMCLVGKNDWCGTTQVEQLLLRMEASRKTIVLLSGKFSESTQCRYVLGVLEEWLYTEGKDKSILITFAPHPPDAGTFRRRHQRNPGSVLNYAASLSEENSNPMFWELLRNAMKIISCL